MNFFSGPSFVPPAQEAPGATRPSLQPTFLNCSRLHASPGVILMLCGSVCAGGPALCASSVSQTSLELPFAGSTPSCLYRAGCQLGLVSEWPGAQSLPGKQSEVTISSILTRCSTQVWRGRQVPTERLPRGRALPGPGTQCSVPSWCGAVCRAPPALTTQRTIPQGSTPTASAGDSYPWLWGPLPLALGQRPWVPYSPHAPRQTHSCGFNAK